MKICCISDLHGHFPEIPECDYLVIAGDIFPGTDPYLQSVWCNDLFRPWLDKVPAKYIVGTGGNHDWLFTKMDLVPEMNWTYLNHESKVVGDFKFYGNCWTRRFFDWAFNTDEEHLKSMWEEIPDDTDIVITHSPPKGYGDLCRKFNEKTKNFGEGYINVGSPSLLSRIKEINPKLHVFGHIHNGYSINKLGQTKLVNASIVNEQYKPVNKPIIMEIE